MSDFEHEVTRNFRWNFTVNLVDLSFIMFGISLISRETVLPLLVSKLTISTVAIGLIGLFGERLPYGLSALAVLGLAASNPTMALVALAALLGLSGASAGFATPAWFDLIAKVIPVRRRGLFTGLSFGLGALMGVAGAAMLISWGGLMLNREPASPSVRVSAPLLGGWLAGLLGYQPMFAITMIIAAAGAIMLARLVREPRRHQRPALVVANSAEA